MNIIKIVVLSLLLPLQVKADAIPLGGIEVKLDVITQPLIKVEKPGGGWYNRIQLKSNVENPSIYQTEVPITVKLHEQDGYRISVKNPLILTRHAIILRGVTQQGHPMVSNIQDHQEFSPAEIRWGSDHTNLRLLSAIPETFYVDNSTSRQTSTHYLLQISAQAPRGKNTAGKYHGQLTLLFETNS
ncbi:hypothetical protein [Yersinia pekkanenii]|uniref:Alpha-related fimbriae minor subunit 2 n=1 Tax=Yersinia pekkanenii TaxID=1288385 RepID=A0A0T9NQT7_9GAMM|nr:hypothetical protein [Yersinia pekkanenii]CNH25239.1 alpha-related fimbriae minor subunit 2 [Yersinia pekkanenii]CRY67209.1 alpha-related fimbriae minor subunit 2 [Yersinia pekkanenii]